MKIAILGTRGIPNHYGGFEQFAEYLSEGLYKAGFDVTVYNSHTHPYQDANWRGVKIIHCYDPETKLGTIGQFVYDLNCIMDSRRRNFDIILQLGYTSSSIWFNLQAKSKTIVTTNMDGLEWRRTKYSNRVKQFIKYAEGLAVKRSHHLISDSTGIQNYLQDTYNASSTYIPYGAHVFSSPDKGVLSDFKLTPYSYNLLIARLEPENSIEVILDGVSKSTSKTQFLVIGKDNSKYGLFLKEKYKLDSNIHFVGGVYDINKLNNLRYYSKLYFHGHTVGGTNPSLLEAMSSSAFICAHNNIFNKSILGEDAFYFENSLDVINIISDSFDKKDIEIIDKTNNNLDKISKLYSWPIIIDQYINHFKSISS